jgi:hypothetical protein
MVVNALTPYIPEPDYITLHEALICTANKQYNISNYQLIRSTSTIDVYKCSLEPTISSPTRMKYIIIVIKTKDLCLSNEYWNLWVSFKYNFINLEKYFDGTILQNNDFYENVKNDINSIITMYSKPSYIYSIVGQGEGGAMIDDLILNNYVDYGILLNPLIESKHFKDRSSKNLSPIFYSADSPFRKTFGKLIDVANTFPWKLRYDNFDSRWIYINTKPILVSNSVDNESFYQGPGLRKWSSVSMTYNGQYQIASTFYGNVFRSYDYGQSWEINRELSNPFSTIDYKPVKLHCSKVKIGSHGFRALFLQENKLYISKTVGSTWTHVSDVVIPHGYNKVLENSYLYISDYTMCLMVYIPGDSRNKHLLFISYDSGEKWVDYTKRKSSDDYINFKNMVNDYAASHPNYEVYNNESDLDHDIPYVYGETTAYKFFVSIEKYLWRPTNTVPMGWTNPIFSFKDARISNVFNNLQWERPFFNDDDPEISYSEGFNKITGVFPGGNIHYAEDFGNLWKKAETPASFIFLHNWKCVNLSYSGNFQVIADYNGENGDGGIYVSSNAGKNWTSVLKKDFNWTSLAISSNGKIITAICEDMYYPNKNTDIKKSQTYIDGGFICISYDGGNTWKERR